MKIFIYAFSVLLILCLVGCRKEKTNYKPILEEAQSLMYSHPDRALSLLDSINIPLSDKEQYAEWCILITQARDKNYLKQSDSLLCIASDYFMNRSDPQRRALVLNYQGRFCEERGENEKATECYLKASDEISQTEDYRLAFLINSNLGMIYAYRSLNEKALASLSEANRCALLAEDSSYIVSSLIGLGRIYGQTKQYDKSLDSYRKSIQRSKAQSDKKVLKQSLIEIASIYRRIEKYDSSLIYLREAECLENQKDFPYPRQIYQTYLGIGNTYRYLKQHDSAMVYLKKALATDNLYTKRSIYQCLFLISKKQKNMYSIVNYSEKYLAYRDSVDSISHSKAIAEIEAKYEKEKLKNENSLLEASREKTIKLALMTLLLLFILIGFLIYRYQHRLLEKERMINRINERMKTYLVKLNESDEIIKENKIHLKNEIQNFRKFKINVNGLLIKQIPLLNKLSETTPYVKENEWKNIEKEINLIFNDFTIRFSKDYFTFTPIDIHVASLIKLGFSNKEIAKMIGISPASVVKRKQRMKERLNLNHGIELDKNQSLDDWIIDY